MKYDGTIFRSQYPIVAHFVLHLAYHRAGKATYDHLCLTSPFWTATLDSYLMVATMHWCKVFGAYGPNPTHWTKTPAGEAEALQDAFRSEVLSAATLTWQQWDDYWKTMCSFRDRYVAHCEISFANPVPHFDIALNVAYAYDKWIRDLIKPDILDDLWLKEHFQIWMKTARPILESAMRTTQGMKE